MTKKEKLEKLEELVRNVNEIEYDRKLEIGNYLNDTIVFVNHAFCGNTLWEKEILRMKQKFERYGAGSNPYSDRGMKWKNTKTEFVGILCSIKKEIDHYTKSIPTGHAEDKKEVSLGGKIFIVHGHNEAMRLAVARSIETMGLFPIILGEQIDDGETIIGKFEKHADEAGFAIVLMSPDDKLATGEYQARPNVFLELGYFRAKLGKGSVLLLNDTSGENSTKMPSDLYGVLYVPYDSTDGVWRYKVAESLRKAGFPADSNKL